jgi:hypothetical protein
MDIFNYCDNWCGEHWWIFQETEFRFWLFVALVPIAEVLLWKLARWAWRWRGSHIGLFLLLLCLAPDNNRMFYIVLDHQINRELRRHVLEDVEQSQPTFGPEGEWFSQDV